MVNSLYACMCAHGSVCLNVSSALLPCVVTDVTAFTRKSVVANRTFTQFDAGDFFHLTATILNNRNGTVFRVFYFESEGGQYF